MRFDVNISLAEKGSKTLGKRAEIKNLNSFRSVERAIEYEYERQSKMLDNGEVIIQETRGWNDATGKTTSQRSKEEAQDYRYMPEPDLPPIRLTAEQIKKEQENMPLLPADYRATLGMIVPQDILEILLDYKQLVDKLAELKTEYDIQGVSKEVSKNSILKISNLFTSVLLAEENSSLLNDPLPSAKQLIDLCNMIAKNELSSTSVKEVFLRFFDQEMRFKDTRSIAKELNLIQENDLGAVEKIVDDVLADPNNAQAIADFKAGSEKVLGFLVGQVMKASRGKANPGMAQEILRKKLA